MIRRPLLPLLGLATTLNVLAARGPDSAAAGTVPFIFDDNRMVAELVFVRPDGALRKTLAFVDLGTPVPVITEQLAKELQFDPHTPMMLRAGTLQIPLESAGTVTVPRLFRTGPDGRATLPVEAILSGSILKDYQVVFDYAKRTLTLARPATLTPSGSAVPCRVNEKTGLIAVDAAIAGRSYAIAVDPGSAYTWVRADIAEQWVTAHPDWKRGTGAVGEANMQTRAESGEPAATILRVSQVGLGALRLTQIGALGIASEAPPFPPVPGESPEERHADGRGHSCRRQAAGGRRSAAGRPHTRTDLLGPAWQTGDRPRGPARAGRQARDGARDNDHVLIAASGAQSLDSRGFNCGSMCAS